MIFADYIIFAPNILSLDVFMDIHDYKIVTEIIKLLYYADIERINKKVYEEFLKNKKLIEWE